MFTVMDYTTQASLKKKLMESLESPKINKKKSKTQWHGLQNVQL